MKELFLPAHIELATYNTSQRQPRYQGNRLIEALPAPLSDIELFEALEFLPAFDESSREWDSADRIRELLSLTNIMVPMTSHIQLGHSLDSMLREGYVGRQPMSVEHINVYEEIHRDKQAAKSGQPFRQTHNTLPPKLSQALVGVSGMGKTTTVQRTLARYPRVIYHPDLNVYQIPWLHFEMPRDGGGVKALLQSIIEAIADLIPDNTYYEDYVLKARPTEGQLQSSVRILLNKHLVGLLIPDEVQNAANKRKSEQVVMTELTTLANKSRAPVLYIGTPKARKVLGLDMRQGRRALNLGLGDWTPLPRYSLSRDETGALVKKPGEWVDFMTQLWKYNWLRKQVPMSDGLLDVIYECTQGIIDLGIKLFIVAQARAMVDKTEMLSEQLFLAVYAEQFQVIHPMIDACIRGDREALDQYGDLELPSTEDLIQSSARQERLSKVRAASNQPGTEEFRARLTAAAETLGISPEDASALAQQVSEEGTAKSLLDGVAQLANNARPPKAVSSGSKGKRGSKADADALPSYPGLEARPDDFRNAIVLAAVKKTSIVEQLLQLNMVPELEDVICLG
ncbi:AAA family ATPase [Rubrivivax sp. RP6-9]|uniref:AAA family ATPase n=1 Tax=Rubrivivax sp. RP6-9 TaxID=3415750 RepID=UPI003CC624C6